MPSVPSPGARDAPDDARQGLRGRTARIPTSEGDGRIRMASGLSPVAHTVHSTYYHDEELISLFHTVMRSPGGPAGVVPIPEAPQ